MLFLLPYHEIMNDIAPAEIEDIDVTIKLANRDTITPLGIVRDVEALCGKIKYPTDFLVLGSLIACIRVGISLKRRG